MKITRSKWGDDDLAINMPTQENLRTNSTTVQKWNETAKRDCVPRWGEEEDEERRKRRWKEAKEGQMRLDSN